MDGKRLVKGLLAIGLWALLACVVQIPATTLLEARRDTMLASERKLEHQGPDLGTPFPALRASEAEGVELRVPLAVRELVKPGHSGLPREEEPVTVGVPLPEEAAVTGVAELAVEGVATYQIRPLAYWPASGHLKWVLLDFPITLDALEQGRVHLVRSQGVAPEGRIAVDRGTHILVDTGPMKVWLAKQGTGLVRRVKVDGEILVDGEDAFRLEALGLEGESFPAVVSPGTQVEVIETGPQKGVVRAVGSHVSSSGDHLMDFELRFTAFRGKRFLRVEYTLKNASKDHPRHIRHRGIRLDLATALGEGKEVTFPLHDDPWRHREPLAPGDEAYYYCAYNDSRQEGAKQVRRDWPYDGWVPPIEYDFETDRFLEEGYRIVKNGEPVRPQTSASEFNDVTYVDLADSRGAGAYASIRFGTRYWPISYEGRGDGTLSVGLFSDRIQHEFTVNYYQHETRELVLGFHATPESAFPRAHMESYPLMARVTDVDYLNRCEALTDKLVSMEEMNAFFEEVGLDARVAPDNEPFKIVRYWNAGQGGGLNQLDETYHGLVRFWRTGDSGAFLQAKCWADYRADWAVIHTDDFVYAQNGDPRFPLYYPVNSQDFLTTRDHIFDNQHRHTRGLPLMYYFTGNDRYLRAFLEDTEVVTFSDRVELHYLNSRIQSKLLHLGTLAYRILSEVDPIIRFEETSPFSREEIYERMRGYLRAILDARYDMSRKCDGHQPKGWSDEPGQSVHDPRRFWFAGGDRDRNVEPKFTVFSLFPDALWNYHQNAEPYDSNLGEVRARILDLAHYFWHYLFSDCPEDPAYASVGDLLYTLFDGSCEIPETPECADGDDFHPAYQLLTFAYRVSGNPTFLHRGVRFMIGQHETGYQLLPLTSYRTDFQNFVHTYMEADLDGPVTSELRLSMSDEGQLAARWTTDELSTGQVLFWEDPSDRRETELEEEPGRAHLAFLPDLEPLVPYRYQAMNRDLRGNWSASRVRTFGFDDFRADTLGAYERVERRGARIEFDRAAGAVRFTGAPGSRAVLTLERPRGELNGAVAFDFRPGRALDSDASLSILLIQDAENYYELTAFAGGEGRDGMRLRKVVSGATVKGAGSPRRPLRKEDLRGRFIFARRLFGVEERGSDNSFGVNTPRADPLAVRTVSIVLRSLEGSLEGLLIETD